MKKCIIIVCKYFGKVKPGDKLRDVSFVGNKNNSPNIDTFSPNVDDGISVSIVNQAFDEAKGKPDYTFSSPKRYLNSPKNQKSNGSTRL
jgi:hypothetical protein